MSKITLKTGFLVKDRKSSKTVRSSKRNSGCTLISGRDKHFSKGENLFPSQRGPKADCGAIKFTILIHLLLYFFFLFLLKFRTVISENSVRIIVNTKNWFHFSAYSHGLYCCCCQLESIHVWNKRYIVNYYFLSFLFCFCRYFDS